VVVFALFADADFVAILRLSLTRARVQFAAETKCAQYLGASDDENLWAGISWLTFLLGTLRALAAMPAGLIEEENSVRARGDFGCDFIEVKLHSFGVAGWQHEGGAGSAFGADRTKEVGRLGSLIVGGTGA
jgi:hypothetical protein